MNVPKHSFIVWLAVQQRLVTKDRLLKFGIITDAVCDMCLAHQEDHHHLLYGCPFSAQSLELFERLVNINMPLVGVFGMGTSPALSFFLEEAVVLAAMVALVYHIWTVRNKCRIELQLPRPCRVLADVQATARLHRMIKT
ncbi:uncharacterized protein LOC141640270 [Silene latifolia]|uniref:uncharacterized protein LOC141640270 n=1 Tax=Silene latifolia TaxID=37657 RepID=UPI003D78005E